MAWHHPEKGDHPDWLIWIGNQWFHKAVTIIQRMRATPENLAVIRGFIDSLEWEYLHKRRILDVEDSK